MQVGRSGYETHRTTSFNGQTPLHHPSRARCKATRGPLPSTRLLLGGYLRRRQRFASVNVAEAFVKTPSSVRASPQLIEGVAGGDEFWRSLHINDASAWARSGDCHQQGPL